MADEVKIIECPRDAWQGLPRTIPTEEKISCLRALISAGFRHLDAVSFVSPRRVPQMADSEIVLEALRAELGGVEIIGIVVNEKGLERALAAPGVSTLGYPLSISPTFQQRNTSQSIEEGRAFAGRLLEATREAGRKLVVYISMAFGNPFGDPYSPVAVAKEVERLRELGVGTLSLADTVGRASAEDVRQLFGAVLPKSEGIELGLHLHSAPDGVEEKVRAAFEAGCRRLDSALAGLGGCPFAGDKQVGNLPTERALAALEALGARSGPPHDALAMPLSLTNEIALRYGTQEKEESGS